MKRQGLGLRLKPGDIVELDPGPGGTPTVFRLDRVDQPTATIEYSHPATGKGGAIRKGRNVCLHVGGERITVRLRVVGPAHAWLGFLCPLSVGIVSTRDGKRFTRPSAAERGAR